jgi:hypothetical protein
VLKNLLRAGKTKQPGFLSKTGVFFEEHWSFCMATLEFAAYLLRTKSRMHQEAWIGWTDTISLLVLFKSLARFESQRFENLHQRTEAREAGL